MSQITQWPGARRVLACALLAVVVLPPVAACQSSSPRADGHAGSPSPSARTDTTGTTGSTGVAAGTYVTGAKITDNACARVISAIGYLDPLLLPSGEEKRQRYDDAVRGRFGYVAGTIAEYGSRLPDQAREAARQVGEISETMSSASTEDDRRPGLMRDYRKASQAIATACATQPS
ncbi:hypothetical protein AB0K60_23540 [Thermopolyspora sp. NPDC052614]|uniref:hypothetical protein n=1 Tax=Thermopolyspora sp. NPDC052614 TaxID=3155682 RepID=UPI0034363066